MLTWASVALYLAKFLNAIADLFRSKREREAGRDEAKIEQHEANNAALKTATDASRDNHARDLADPGRLRAPNKYLRD